MKSRRSSSLVTLGLISLMIGVAGSGGGCTSYLPPTMQIADARVTERTAEGVTMAFSLDATNINEEALPLREVRYTVEIDGKQAFSGIRSAEATLRRRGTQQITLPASIPADQIPALGPEGVVRFRLTGTLQYVTPGAFAELLFDTGVRRPKAPFVQQGVIDLSAPPSEPPNPNAPPPIPTDSAPEPENP